MTPLKVARRLNISKLTPVLLLIHVDYKTASITQEGKQNRKPRNKILYALHVDNLHVDKQERVSSYCCICVSVLKYRISYVLQSNIMLVLCR
jgi:hypothetical protein